MPKPSLIPPYKGTGSGTHSERHQAITYCGLPTHQQIEATRQRLAAENEARIRKFMEPAPCSA